MREELLRSKHGENTQVEIPQARNKVKKAAGGKEGMFFQKNVQKGIIVGDILPLKEKMELFKSDTTDLTVCWSLTT